MTRRTSGKFLRIAAGGTLCMLALSLRVSAISGAEPPAAVIDLAEADVASPPLMAQGEALNTVGAEAVAEMQRAQAGFADGRLNDDTEAQQARIMQQLRRLSDLARRQSKPVAGGRSSSSSSAGHATPGVNAGDGQGAVGRSSRAAESSEKPRGPDEIEAHPATARDLATSVWGHLPARQRDRMQSRFSERFLPQYAELVRRYYEALATEDVDAESSRQSVP